MGVPKTEAAVREFAVKAAERAIVDDGGEDHANRRATEALLKRLRQHHTPAEV
jgi:hypothetical protein